MIVVKLKCEDEDVYINMDDFRSMTVPRDGGDVRLYVGESDEPWILTRKEANQIVKVITKNKVEINEAK